MIGSQQIFALNVVNGKSQFNFDQGIINQSVYFGVVLFPCASVINLTLVIGKFCNF